MSPTFDYEAYVRSRYLDKSWAKVLEENEHFDGEKEIAAAAKREWQRVNREARLQRRQLEAKLGLEPDAVNWDYQPKASQR